MEAGFPFVTTGANFGPIFNEPLARCSSPFASSLIQNAVVQGGFGFFPFGLDEDRNDFATACLWFVRNEESAFAHHFSGTGPSDSSVQWLPTVRM